MRTFLCQLPCKSTTKIKRNAYKYKIVYIILKLLQRQLYIWSTLPGKSFSHSEVSEKMYVLQSCPQNVLSVPLCKSDGSTKACSCHVEYKIRGEDVMLRTSIFSRDHLQVIRPVNQNHFLIYIHILISPLKHKGMKKIPFCQILSFTWRHSHPLLSGKIIPLFFHTRQTSEQLLCQWEHILVW